jgi:DNA-dependent RNA polymerase auxiliary subunit epsilon
MEKTVDSRHARDYISIVSEDPDVHILKVINQDQNGLTPYTESTYNVFVRSYSETLIRRDLSDGVYYFDCSLTLEEA